MSFLYALYHKVGRGNKNRAAILIFTDSRPWFTYQTGETSGSPRNPQPTSSHAEQDHGIRYDGHTRTGAAPSRRNMAPAIRPALGRHRQEPSPSRIPTRGLPTLPPATRLSDQTISCGSTQGEALAERCRTKEDAGQTAAILDYQRISRRFGSTSAALQDVALSASRRSRAS